TAYSIWRKMQKQEVPFEGVYDVFAIRFIIDCDGDAKAEKDVCWNVYSLVTAEYEADNSRLRDWLSKPKPNGYESLHITVKNKDGAYLEVQIRTKRMDDIAESGLASHWSYKGVRSGVQLEGWLKSVRNILEHPATGNDYEFPESPFGEIFVFTPTGELRHLAQGATVLDFAFDIHTNLGMKCVGGKVNGKAVSIREKLHTGDAVEILSGKNQKPSSDWLSFVVTSKARARIKRYFSEIAYAREAEGRELLERRLKNWKLEMSDEQLANFMSKRTPYKTLTAFYGAVGDGTFDISEIRNYLKEEEDRVAERRGGVDAGGAASRVTAGLGADDAVGDEIAVIGAKDIRGLDFKFAKCCNPVFGDDVFGFVSIRDGIKIHRISCPNASRLIDMYPYRIRKVRWSGVSDKGSFQVGLRLIAEHDASVVNGIMEVVSSFKASVRSINVIENGRLGTYDINMKLSVSSNLELDKVMSKLRALRNVSKVSRL
ncbi:MAG: TGS domain-containing protein, partial [Bacteroidales bacterium]|nr:TGS domain-containing protein [Bacteroidales bacterium]